MNCGEKRYIWQADDWPNWRYDLPALARPLTEISRAQGLLLGRLADVGLTLRDQASLAALTEDVVKTSEIEGEVLNVESVRSSIARRLGPVHAMRGVALLRKGAGCKAPARSKAGRLASAGNAADGPFAQQPEGKRITARPSALRSLCV